MIQKLCSLLSWANKARTDRYQHRHNFTSSCFPQMWISSPFISASKRTKPLSSKFTPRNHSCLPWPYSNPPFPPFPSFPEAMAPPTMFSNSKIQNSKLKISSYCITTLSAHFVQTSPGYTSPRPLPARDKLSWRRAALR